MSCTGVAISSGWHVGDRPLSEFRALRYDEDPAVLFDPAKVVVTVEDPEGTTATSQYGQSGQAHPVTRVSVGVFTIDVPLDPSGDETNGAKRAWKITWYAYDGQDQVIIVEPSKIVAFQHAAALPVPV